MLKVFAQIFMALLMVYGFYCIIISVTYMIFRGAKDSLVVAIIDKNGVGVDSQFILAKRIFSVGVPIVIMTDKNADESEINELKRKYPNMDIYRTEKLYDERADEDN